MQRRRPVLIFSLAATLLLTLTSCGLFGAAGTPEEIQVNGYVVERDSSGNPTGKVEIGISAFDSGGTLVESATVRSVSATVNTTGYTASGGVCGNITAGSGPLAAVLMLDESTSMNSTDSARDRGVAAEAFVNQLGNNDVASIAFFPARSGSVTSGLTNSEVVAPFTSGKSDLIAGINAVTSGYGGITPIWDAAYDAVTLLSGRSEPNLAAIILTDGGENNSIGTVAAANQFAQNEGVKLFALGFGSASASELDALVAGTGGYRDVVDSSNPATSISNLLDNIFAATQAQGCIDLTFSPAPTQGVRLQGTVTVNFATSQASAAYDIGF
jgi:hypothetical protein